MASFGEKSLKNLLECHEHLQVLFFEVVKGFDCSVICGHRTEEEQMKAFNAEPQLSKVKFPDSRHNKKPSLGVDVVPYPVNWIDLKRFYMFGGYVKAVSERLNLNIRWGGDWDSDTIINDQKFIDLPHYELIL